MFIARSRHLVVFVPGLFKTYFRAQRLAWRMENDALIYSLLSSYSLIRCADDLMFCRSDADTDAGR